MSLLVCPKCKYQAENNEAFCCKCGAKLEHVQEKAFCKSCGSELKPDAHFCAQCGAKCLDLGKIKCSRCGALLNEKDMFCSQCGAQNESVHSSSSPFKSGEEIELLFQQGMEDFYNKRYFSAIEKFKKPAEQGHPKAQYYLAECLGDRKEAKIWKKKAAENGIVDKNADDNPEELLGKAGQGDALSQYKLGMHYLHSYGGVEQLEHLRNDKDFRKKTLKWLQQSADQDYAPAQYELATIYPNLHLMPISQLKEEIHSSVFLPTKMAKRKYRLEMEQISAKLICSAAEQGHAGAMVFLGALYENGWWNFEKNTAMAFRLYCQAAKEYPQAEFEVGLCYEKGIGTSKDIEEASIWYQKAAEHGYGYDMQNSIKRFDHNWFLL